MAKIIISKNDNVLTVNTRQEAADVIGHFLGHPVFYGSWFKTREVETIGEWSVTRSLVESSRRSGNRILLLDVLREPWDNEEAMWEALKRAANCPATPGERQKARVRALKRSVSRPCIVKTTWRK